jgi:hypothetical protein
MRALQQRATSMSNAASPLPKQRAVTSRVTAGPNRRRKSRIGIAEPDRSALPADYVYRTDIAYPASLPQTISDIWVVMREYGGEMRMAANANLQHSCEPIVIDYATEVLSRPVDILKVEHDECRHIFQRV